MYEFAGKLKTLSITLMLIGLVGIATGFFKGMGATEADAEKVVEHLQQQKELKAEKEAQKVHYGRVRKWPRKKEVDKSLTPDVEHTLHHMHNRPWAALYTSMIFFFMVALLIFVFYAMHNAASAGWPVVLYRLYEAFSVNLMPIGIFLLIFFILAAMGTHHLFPWMHVEGDEVLEAKSFWLNVPGWTIRAIIIILGYIGLRYIIVKKNSEQDFATDYTPHEKAFRWTIIFIAFFMLSEAVLGWDWLMSLDPHWFSTLYSWYAFASAMVTGIAVMILIVLYLKSKGYLEYVHDSHLHDLGKYMFGFSIFWTYLWFSQYMLIWYANMPEETAYFAARMIHYKGIFLGLVVLNFVFPILVLMDIEAKRKKILLIITAIIVIVGHYLDFYLMIMPSTVGENWHIGIPEIGAFLFFAGLFIFFGFKSLTKRPLLPKNNPYLEESEHFHYYNL